MLILLRLQRLPPVECFKAVDKLPMYDTETFHDLYVRLLRMYIYFSDKYKLFLRRDLNLKYDFFVTKFAQCNFAFAWQE